jgi:hypothetical protein
MDHRHLTTLSTRLAAFLAEVLPRLSDHWWQTHVLEELTFQQRSYVDTAGYTRLDQLDLAALLRIADRNWSEIAHAASLPPTTRNWLKEAQTIRNRWAHAPVSGIPDDERFRDLDTIERLMQAIGADQPTLADIHAERTALLAQLAGSAKPADQPSATASQGAFDPGQLVRLKAQPTVTGAVVSRAPADPEDRYQVFHDGAVTTYYASQIEPAAVPAARPSVTPAALHAALTAAQLRHPSIGNLYSLFASRIQFVPYQFRPVLKLIQADRPRLLIADEVGVGKTIEAGLILKELQARRELRTVLVICPKPLVAERKWLEEMKRFDERFDHLDGPALRYCIEETHLDGVWPQKYARAILPYSLLDEALLMGDTERRRPRRGLLGLDPPPAFDLVIVDEAHHIRNTETWAYRAVRWFCDNAEAVVLLSATPIQLGDPDLYTLLHLLRPDLLPSRREYEQMAEPNPHINAAIESVRGAGPDWRGNARAAIQAAIATPWGRNVLTADPRTQTAHDLLDAADPTPDDRLSLVGLLEGLYTFSPLINRTRRRDIGSFTTRKPETVAVDYTPEQQALHADLIQLIGAMLARRHGDRNLRFMLTTVHRQLASCVFGLAPYLEAILDRHLSQLELCEMGDDDSPDVLSDTFDQFRAEVQSIVQGARALNGPDPKLAAFLKVIHDKQALLNNKLLVFSSFRHTLAYLIAKLADQPVRTGLIHGDIPEEDRRDLRNRFSLPKEDPAALDLLLSSEVGCEGLDYQFCDGLVNYDLPWNPMRVEQRIGRIDRYGQKSETVAIYNFITPGTVDAEIYERCLLRIGVFRQALGGSEEILGRLTREIREIAENLTLTPAEQSARLQQISDNEIRVIQEQTRLEEHQAKLFGLALPKRDEEMVRQAASFWLRPAMLANLIARYLESRGAASLPKSLGSKAVTTLQLGQEVRDKLLADFKALKLTGTVAQAWERWLKGNDPRLAITFDQATADEQRLIAFITPMHPLARQAAEAEEPAAVLTCNLTAQTNAVPPGRYPFAIYKWRRIGLKDDFTFQPVCLHPHIAKYLLELLEFATPRDCDVDLLAADEEARLEQVHYRLWLDARAAHMEQVQSAAVTRVASLSTTHAARLALLEEQRITITESRIVRMREAQITAAHRDYEQRATDLRRACQQSDVIAASIAMGMITVTGDGVQ